jgi:hypothetical protein
MAELTLAGIPVRTDPQMPDGYAALVAPGCKPVVSVVLVGQPDTDDHGTHTAAPQC